MAHLFVKIFDAQGLFVDEIIRIRMRRPAPKQRPLNIELSCASLDPAFRKRWGRLVDVADAVPATTRQCQQDEDNHAVHGLLPFCGTGLDGTSMGTGRP